MTQNDNSMSAFQSNLTNLLKNFINCLDDKQKEIYNTIILSEKDIFEKKEQFNLTLSQEQRKVKKLLEVAKKAARSENNVIKNSLQKNKKRKS